MLFVLIDKLQRHYLQFLYSMTKSFSCILLCCSSFSFLQCQSCDSKSAIRLSFSPNNCLLSLAAFLPSLSAPLASFLPFFLSGLGKSRVRDKFSALPRCNFGNLVVLDRTGVSRVQNDENQSNLCSNSRDTLRSKFGQEGS